MDKVLNQQKNLQALDRALQPYSVVVNKCNVKYANNAIDLDRNLYQTLERACFLF